MNYPQQSLGREAAIKIGESEWWKGRTFREIAKFQLFTKELCCPFEIFHEAIQKTLGRPVYTHEFGMDYDGIVQEFLGERDAPSLEEIINLIPEDKRIIITNEERK